MSDPIVVDPRRPAAPSLSLPLSSQRGSVLIIVSFALFLISVALTYAVPAYQRSRRASRAHDTLVELQRFQTAFQSYASQRGDWPASSPGPGEIPAGMETALSNTGWTERTPIGGRFIWLTNTLEQGERVQAAIAIVTAGDDQVSDDVRQLDELTRHIPETQLDAHRLRSGFRNEPVYVMEH